MITLDLDYADTGSFVRSITFMDRERRVLRYSGNADEKLIEKTTSKETGYLSINGRLPNRDKLTRYSVLLNDNSLVYEDMRVFYENFPRLFHPMGILSSMFNALRTFYPAPKNME
jgi:citrate synthase